MSAFIDRAAVESGDETDGEESDDEALHVGGSDVGDGFVVGARRAMPLSLRRHAHPDLWSVTTSHRQRVRAG
eukprot:COSAG06_NODE_61866_length_266_cov_1.089820_1_plen_71_part_10